MAEMGVPVEAVEAFQEGTAETAEAMGITDRAARTIGAVPGKAGLPGPLGKPEAHYIPEAVPVGGDIRVPIQVQVALEEAVDSMVMGPLIPEAVEAAEVTNQTSQAVGAAVPASY